MDNCYETCPFAGESFDCNGERCTTEIPKLETLDQVDIDCASHSLITEGDK